MSYKKIKKGDSLIGKSSPPFWLVLFLESIAMRLKRKIRARFMLKADQKRKSWQTS